MVYSRHISSRLDPSGRSTITIRGPLLVRSLAIRLVRAHPARAAVVLAFAAWSIAVTATFAVERAALRRDEKKAVAVPGEPGPFTRRFDMPGLDRPPAVPADSAGLADDEEVIGVVVSGRPRAYRLKALENPPWHIVNDVVGAVPITVSHCDISGCTRVYAGRPGSGPLGVAQAGLVAGEMVVKVGGVVYVHRTGRPLDPASGGAGPPFAEHAWERTTWRGWVGRHPETDVFVSGPRGRPD